jgi:hypothetical protein
VSYSFHSQATFLDGFIGAVEVEQAKVRQRGCHKTVSAHYAQKVHSNEQMRASVDSGGKSLSQHSQLDRSSSISFSRWMGWKVED